MMSLLVRTFYVAVVLVGLNTAFQLDHSSNKVNHLPHRSDDSSEIERLLSSTSICDALLFDNLEIAKRLIEKGANVNEKDENECFPINLAAEKGYMEIVKLLLENGANVNGEGLFAIHMAIGEGHKEIVEFLISHGADVNAKTVDSWTPMGLFAIGAIHNIINVCSAIFNNQLITFEHHAEKHVVAALGTSEIAQILIEHGADINAKGLENVQPIEVAAYTGEVEVAKILIQNGADVNARDFDNQTPMGLFAIGAIHNIINVCSAIFNNQLITLEHYGGKHMAAANGFVEFVKLLIDNGAIVNARDVDDSTPLMFSVYSGSVEVTSILIENGAKVNAKNADLMTPLHYAATNGDEEVVQLLLDNGAKVNAQDEDKHTCLHYAVKEGKVKVVEILINNGADVKLRNKDDHTALDIIESINEDHIKIIDLLRKAESQMG